MHLMPCLSWFASAPNMHLVHKRPSNIPPPKTTPTPSLQHFDRDGDGCISADEVRRILMEAGEPEPSNDEVKAIISQVDENGDGGIDWKEVRASWVRAVVSGGRASHNIMLATMPSACLLACPTTTAAAGSAASAAFKASKHPLFPPPFWLYLAVRAHDGSTIRGRLPERQPATLSQRQGCAVSSSGGSFVSLRQLRGPGRWLLRPVLINGGLAGINRARMEQFLKSTKFLELIPGLNGRQAGHVFAFLLGASLHVWLDAQPAVHADMPQINPGQPAVVVIFCGIELRSTHVACIISIP